MCENIEKFANKILVERKTAILSKMTNNRSKVSDDGGGGDGGRIFPGHPGPIPNAPRDNIYCKGIPSLRS